MNKRFLMLSAAPAGIFTPVLLLAKNLNGRGAKFFLSSVKMTPPPRCYLRTDFPIKKLILWVSLDLLTPCGTLNLCVNW